MCACLRPLEKSIANFFSVRLLLENRIGSIVLLLYDFVMQLCFFFSCCNGATPIYHVAYAGVVRPSLSTGTVLWA
jgi:hypothetical protein